MADLLVIVPSRGRPGSVDRVVSAWVDTGGYAHADLVFAVDADDPTLREYYAVEQRYAERTLVRFVVLDEWLPMVRKLNQAAVFAARAEELSTAYPMLAFMGDDHLPRSYGWAGRYMDELRQLGTGIVYGDDRIQGERLPTQWAMTANIVRALGRMVPADVEHLYCDNAILDLGHAADCIRYLPDVVIEHCHPVAGRGSWDDGYRRVNARGQYVRDHATYQRWRSGQMPADVETVRRLREAVTAGGSR